MHVLKLRNLQSSKINQIDLIHFYENLEQRMEKPLLRHFAVA